MYREGLLVVTVHWWVLLLIFTVGYIAGVVCEILTEERRI